MTRDELKNKIKSLIPQVYKTKQQSDNKVQNYQELVKFPELKKIIINLLTDDFDSFLSSIDWVAPRPTTFRINLKNDSYFYILWNGRSWIAEIEGKKYYLLNLPEEERAAQAISLILRYNPIPPQEESPSEEDELEDFEDSPPPEEEEDEVNLN